ncbi:hypothetical protein C8R42DRAFT_718286 [Lentinula raphanica]|nr:hypothetical protein C8R42DRAFT_718286 [Lentinula raphanica]
MSLLPPELPKDAVYTPYWCEENVYLLVQSFSQNPLLSETWDVFVVFISNHNRTARRTSSDSAKAELENHLALIGRVVESETLKGAVWGCGMGLSCCRLVCLLRGTATLRKRSVQMFPTNCKGMSKVSVF